MRAPVAVILAVVAGCFACAANGHAMDDQDGSGQRPSAAAREGRLTVRPGAPTIAPLAPGLHPLGLGTPRDGLVYAPKSHDAVRPAPLIVLLHGAGGDAGGALSSFLAAAERDGLVLLAVDSRAATWDVIVDRLGPDVAFLDAALGFAFARWAIDPGRVAIEGFSDGASYALTLGAANGDLFTDVVAFSPGFAVPPDARGRPRLFVSHGTEDRVLPIDRCGRPIAAGFRREGYDVTYREFRGGHGVPPDVAAEALRWFLAPRRQGPPIVGAR
jgi:phospholipase/carboxylesterase